MQFIDTRGRTRAYFPAVESGSGRQSMSSEFEIMRGDLVRILHGLTKDHPRVRRLFNTTVEAFTQDDAADPAGRVHVRFGNGRREAFDLVVMAGNVVPLLAPGTLSATMRRIADHVIPLGLVVAGFGLDADHLPPGCPVTAIDAYDRACAAAGLQPVRRYATWDRQRWSAGAGYVVTIHTRD